MSREESQRFFQAIRNMEAEGDTQPLPAELEERLVAGVLQQHRRRRRGWMAATSVLALAASLALVLLWRRPGTQSPDYALHITGDAQMLGSQPDAVRLQVAIDSVLRVELRPRLRVSGAVVVLPYLRQTGAPYRWPVKLVPSVQGTFLLQAPARELGLSRGRWDLAFAVGAGEEPALAQIAEAFGKESPVRVGGWQVLHQRIEVTAN